MRLSDRFVFVLLAVIAFGLLASGLILGEVARLQPCYLCNFQRLLYIVAGSIALCGVLVPVWRRLWSALVGLTALGGVAAALWQSWMQYAPQSVTECGFGEPTLLERVVDWLGMQWPSLFMVTGTCTSKDWVFLGLSLANWSAIFFSALFAMSLGLYCRRSRR